MADDQVKYSDLIAQDVQPGLTMLAEALKAVTEQIASLKTEATALKGAMSAAGTATREQQQATAQQAASVEGLSKKVKQLTEEERRLEDVRKRYKKLTDEQIERVNAFQQALRGSTQQQMAAVNAIEVETKSYNELNAMYNALKDSLNAMTVAERQNTEAGKAMTMQSAKIYDTMNELQKATGKYTLQVGKYQAAFDGLGYSFQQILREAPSALNLNQFILAISNNIPMFLDQLKAFKNEQAEIKANLATMTKGTAEYAEQLDKVESVGKKLGKVLISWQSLVLVGLLILRNFDRIVAGISNLFNKVTKEQQRLNAVNESSASTVGELTAKYKALQKEWQGLKTEDQGEWLKQHKSDWQELGYSIDDAKKAEDFYVNNTSAVQQAIDARARSMAGMKLAAEKYEEMFKLQVKADKAFTTMREMEAAGTAYEYRKERVRYIGNAATGSGTTIVTPAGNYKTGAYAQAGLEYDLYKRQAEELRKEAEEFMKFVQPGTAGGGNVGDGKEPKDQVADLLTLQRQLEDAIIANIENEFEREEAAEIARHQRFIEDKQKELELVKGDAERTAVINQQIEEERNTHDRNMLDIDEKYRQQIIKGIEEQKKAEEQAAKEAERLAKEKIQQEEKDFKAHQEIDKRRFELTKHTAREERKFVMQQQMEFLQWRIDNAKALGISPELLEVMKKEYAQMQEMFNKGIYSTGKKNTYSSGMEVIADVLGFDIDSNQISALNSVFDQAKEALNSWMDARKAAADQAKDLADDEVSAAENALNREIELRNQGYANDVALREKELADAKEKQKQAVELQAKYKKEQVLLDAAMQASSMITASANIFKQFPIYVAIPMLATLWGAFGYAKIQAYQQAEKSIKFKEGGVMLLEGGSHESGHDVNLGIGPDGSNLRAEGGEYFAVINKRSSRKYGSQIPAVVNALNSGMFEDRYIKTSDAVGLLPQVIRADNGSYVDLSKVEGGVSELVKQGEQNWTIEGDYRVLRYKNLTRRVKIG